MAIGLFKKPYVVRKHGAQTVIRGYAQAGYADSIAWLNVQPQAPNDYQANPEGEKTVKHLKSWGADKLASANDSDGVPGDMLYYNGLWYECKSSVMWNHTMLRHYQSDFVSLPVDRQPRQPSISPRRNSP